MIGRRSFLKFGAALFGAFPALRWLNVAGAQSNPQLLIPPTVHHVTENTAHLYCWLEETVTDAVLNVKQNDSLVQSLPLIGGQSIITVENLEPATTYQYEVLVNGDIAPSYQDVMWNTGRFQTQPFEWPLRFLAIGDSGFGDNVTRQLAQHMAVHDVHFFMHLGDIAYRCEEYGNNLVINFAQKYFLPFQQTLNRVPHYQTIGNHDRDFPTRLNGLNFYHYAFPSFEEAQSIDGQRVWYSFVMNDVRFLSLNTQVFFTDAGRQQQNDWLRAQLEDTRFRKTIIFFHIPFRASTSVHPTDGLAAAGDWRELFEEHADQIGLVLSGHAHIYEHILLNNVHYLVSGGGSYSIYEQANVAVPGSQASFSLAHYTLVEIYEDRIHLEAYDVNDTRIDSAAWPI